MEIMDDRVEEIRVVGVLGVGGGPVYPEHILFRSVETFAIL